MTARATQVGGNHYRAMNVQPWDVVDGWPIEQQIGFFRGNALKYLLRFGSKGRTPAAQVEDIDKAIHYLQKLSEVLSTGDDECPTG